MTNYKNLTETKIIDGKLWTLHGKQENEGTNSIVFNDWKYLFSEIISEHVPDKSLVVQAGGWQGVYPALLSEMFETVYTFEPDPVNFYCLTENCQKHNIFKLQVALGQRAGTAMFEEVSTSGQGRIQQSEPWIMPVLNTYNVPMLSIDSLALERCGLIMLDTENLDYQILLGSIKTIQKLKPVVITEKSFKPDQNIKILELFNQLDYSIKFDWTNDYMFVPNL